MRTQILGRRQLLEVERMPKHLTDAPDLLGSTRIVQIHAKVPVAEKLPGIGLICFSATIQFAAISSKPPVGTRSDTFAYTFDTVPPALWDEKSLGGINLNLLSILLHKVSCLYYGLPHCGMQ